MTRPRLAVRLLPYDNGVDRLVGARCIRGRAGDLMQPLQVRALDVGHGDIAVLAVSGELDIDSQDRLYAAVADATKCGNTRMILDCGQLTFCDSVGLGCLLTVHRSLREQGGVLILADLTEPVARVMEIVGVDQVIAVADNRDRALQDILHRSDTAAS